MASDVFSRTLLGHRLIRSKTPQIITSLFNKRSLHFLAKPAYLVYRNSTQAPCITTAFLVLGTKAGFSTHSTSTSDPVVSVDWLHTNLKEPNMKVLDASWYMPDEQRNPLQEYQNRMLTFLVPFSLMWTEFLTRQQMFDGAAAEPRKGIRSGHVPGSKCIPFPQVLDSSQTLLPPDELKK